MPSTPNSKGISDIEIETPRLRAFARQLQDLAHILDDLAGKHAAGTSNIDVIEKAARAMIDLDEEWNRIGAELDDAIEDMNGLPNEEEKPASPVPVAKANKKA